LIYPSGDTIEQKVRSRYSLVVLAAKRAKQIKEGAPVLIDTESSNPLTIAMEEIAAGKVTVIEPSIEPAPPTHAKADSATHDPLLTEAQAGPLLFNGLSGSAGPEADTAPGAAALDLDDPKSERLAEAAGSNASDELTA
jgi:DNA-directed RNA polymerase subunit omega